METFKNGGPVPLHAILQKAPLVGRAEQQGGNPVDSVPELPDSRRVARALDYLVKSDGEYARASAALAAAELRVKQAREVAFLGAEGTQAERAAQANLDPTVTEANKGLEEAIYRKELLKAKRATAQVLIDVWRSLNANQRVTA